MSIDTYLDRLLAKYSDSFDIYMPYKLSGREYPAYGYFYSHNEKYVLVQEANMWSADSYEHLLFITGEELGEELFAQMKTLLEGEMEKELVRGGEKNPPPNHMSSLLTIVFLCNRPPSRSVVKKVESYHFDKGYQFHFRGYCKGRMAVISMEDEKVYLSRAMNKDTGKMLESVFWEVKEGREGFRAICEKQGVKPFSQKQC